MSTEDDKRVVQRYYDEVLNEGNLDVLDEIAVDDYEEHDPLPGQGSGLQGLKDRASLFVSSLKPRFTLHDVIAEDDKVAVRWTNDGRHVGNFLGMPPTDRSFSIAGIDIHRVRDGKLAEHWHVVDQLTMLQQLGVIPGPGA
ncbi:MAG: ester cyclase [Actinomycetota bacterium]